MRMTMLKTCSAVLTLLWTTGWASADPATYDSPEAAVAAVVSAVQAEDRDALLAVFGAENEDVAFTGDPEEDREVWSGFIKGYNRQHRIALDEDDRAVLHIGREDWPFPAAIVNVGGKWSFDAAGAREEVALRRVGLNELDVIDLLRKGVEVQATYRLTDHDGDRVMEFASSVLSTPGKRDGLYWPDEPGTERSPVGDFIARASADGYNFDGTDEEPDPYLGYYFRILQEQGPAASGGAIDYIVNGNMIAGHAFLAYPAAYGETGIMSFMVGENGVVYESDLGEDTLAIGNGLVSFDPGEGWKPVE
jgi:hypothetical protein